MVDASTSLPTEDERTMATLAHALSLLGFIAPLVIFLIKRQSRFVSFHALQALLMQISYFILAMAVTMAWFAIMFSTIMRQAAVKAAGPPMGMFALFPLIWLGFVAGWVLMLIAAIVYSIKASNGEWAEYPVLGVVARKMLKIDPAQAGITPQAR